MRVAAYDLHGLHPSEAVSAAEAACAEAAGGSGGGGGDGTWVALLAGARSHSRRGAASLYDALLARFRSGSAVRGLLECHGVGGAVVVLRVARAW